MADYAVSLPPVAYAENRRRGNRRGAKTGNPCLILSFP